jgi:membrane protease YdiL (CAAX protease family)
VALLVAPAALMTLARSWNVEFTNVMKVLMSGAISLSTVAFIAFWIVKVRGESFALYLRWIPHPFNMRLLIGMGMLLAVAGPMVSSVFPSRARTPMEQLTESSAIYVLAAMSIIVAPFAEEIVFRGFLFRIFADFGGSRSAVVITTILFGASHAPQLWGDWASICVVMVVGGVLGDLRRRSNSVVAPFVVHTAYNTTLIVIGMLMALMGVGET